jgi:hypothetical protein
VLVPLVKGKVQSSFDGTDFESMNMYYVLVDRFNNGNIANAGGINMYSGSLPSYGGGAPAAYTNQPSYYVA